MNKRLIRTKWTNQELQLKKRTEFSISVQNQFLNKNQNLNILDLLKQTLIENLRTKLY